MQTTKRWTTISGLAVLLCVAGTTQAGSINDTKSSMPTRLSMTVTTAKQTPGKTFGESMAGGLQSAGNLVGKGRATTSPPPLVIDCASLDCTIVFPDGNGYRADLQALSLAPLAAAQAEATPKSAPATQIVGQGASLVGAVMPGAGVVSAKVSSVSALANSGSGAAAASYARSTQPTISEVDLSQPLADGNYQLDVVVEKATSGLKDTLKTQVRTAAPQQVRITLGFSVENGVLKARHDTAKNSVANLR